MTAGQQPSPSRQPQRRRRTAGRQRRASRHGPYHGLIHAQRLPNRPCTSVRPTQSSVQTVSGSGLDSGSRLPKKPAATSTAKHGEGEQAGERPQPRPASANSGSRAADKPSERPPAAARAAPGSSRRPPARRRRIVAGRQQQHIAAIGGMGEGVRRRNRQQQQVHATQGCDSPSRRQAERSRSNRAATRTPRPPAAHTLTSVLDPVRLAEQRR